VRPSHLCCSLHVAAEETVAFDDTEILQLIYCRGAAGRRRDRGHAAWTPPGMWSRGAVNTRMGFVTQYKDYDFNSFAMINGRYIGANVRPGCTSWTVTRTTASRSSPG
jgi:hypothetical protein